MKDKLKQLARAVGVNNFRGDNNIHDLLMSPLCDSVQVDPLGSLVGLKQGRAADHLDEQPRRKLMLAAHLDEIGAIVTKVDGEFLRFTQIGVLDLRVLMGQEVWVHGRQSLRGIIGSVPPHLLRGDAGQIDLNDLVVDVGLEADQLAGLVQVGDLISFATEPIELQNDLISGKSLDNRASIAVMLACLEQLQGQSHTWDVYAVATTDEEWGTYVGATTQSYQIAPDVAIALDVTFADAPDSSIKVDGGPVISLGPSNHPVVRQTLCQICDEWEWKYQTEVMARGDGTDAFAIEVSRAGVPTILISLPSRNMHSPVEIVSTKDITRTARLLAQFIVGLDDRFVDRLRPAVA